MKKKNRFLQNKTFVVFSILALCIIHDPKGIYYGGTIAAPVVRRIFENILPYMEKLEKG